MTSKTRKKPYCSTGFPVGCYVDKQGNPQGACVAFVRRQFVIREILTFFLLIQPKMKEANTYYIFNHVNILITYHSGETENWDGNRLLSAKVFPQRCLYWGPPTETKESFFVTVFIKTRTRKRNPFAFIQAR